MENEQVVRNGLADKLGHELPEVAKQLTLIVAMLRGQQPYLPGSQDWDQVLCILPVNQWAKDEILFALEGYLFTNQDGQKRELIRRYLELATVTEKQDLIKLAYQITDLAIIEEVVANDCVGDDCQFILDYNSTASGSGVLPFAAPAFCRLTELGKIW